MENSASTKVSHQQILAKKYIEENDIEKTISEMLNSLVHEKAKQPIVYMIKYLAGLLTEQERKDHGLIIPDPFPKGKPIVKYPDLEKSNSMIKKYLNKNVWSSLKYNKTKCGGNIMNVIKNVDIIPEDKIGCILVDGSSINTFSKIFAPLLSELHNLTNTEVDKEFKPIKEFSMKKSKSSTLNFPYYDRISKNVNKISFSYSRNIQDFPYSAIISHDRRKQVEEIILKAIKSLNNDKILKEGEYFTYSINENEIKEILNKIQFDEDYLRTSELKNSWPDNRGIFVTKEKDVIILVNFIDHLQLIVTTDNNNSEFSGIYNFSKDLIQSIERNLSFDVDKYYGYITVNPLLVGAGFTISGDITLNNLPQSNDFGTLLDNLNFDSRILNNSKFLTKSYCKLNYADELDFAEEYYKKISGLILLDKENIPANFSFNKMKLDDKVDKAIYGAYEKNYEDLKFSISSSGNTLNSIVKFYQENPSNHLGLILSESSDYKIFSRYVNEYLRISQNFEIEKLDTDPNISENDTLIDIKFNHPEKIISTDICLIRNVAEYPFPTSKQAQNLKVEDLIVTALDKLRLGGKYISIENEFAEKIIKENNLIIFHNDDYVKFGIEADFPKNRGIIIIENYNQSENDIHAVVNDFDHLKFHVHIENSNINSNFVNILKISNEFSKQLKFLTDSSFGYLTSSPKYLGTGMIVKSKLKVKNEMIKQTNHLLEEIAKLQKFSYKIIDEEEGIIEIFNQITIGISESELMKNFINVVNGMTDLEI